MTFSLGVLMGLIVGEGSFTEGPRLAVALHIGDPLPLRALQERFGGTIYGPYTTRHPNGTETAMWQWKLGGKTLYRTLGVFDQYLPESRKREQYEAWKRRHVGWIAFQARQLPPLPRMPYLGRPRGVPRPAVQEARRAARRSRRAGAFHVEQ